MYFNNYRTKSQQERLLFPAVSRDSWIICYCGTLQHHEQAADNRPIAISEVDDDDIFIVQLMDDHSPTSTACFWGHRACFSAIFGHRRMFLITSVQRTCSYRLRKQRFFAFSWQHITVAIHDNVSAFWFHHRKRPFRSVSHVICTWLSRVYDKHASEQLLSPWIVAFACFSTCSRIASSPRASRIALKRPQFTPFSWIFSLLWILPTLHSLSLVFR